MDEEDQYSLSEFYYPEGVETSDVKTETGIRESQEAIDDFINKQKKCRSLSVAWLNNSCTCYFEQNMLFLVKLNPVFSPKVFFRERNRIQHGGIEVRYERIFF